MLAASVLVTVTGCVRVFINMPTGEVKAHFAKALQDAFPSLGQDANTLDLHGMLLVSLGLSPRLLL